MVEGKGDGSIPMEGTGVLAGEESGIENPGIGEHPTNKNPRRKNRLHFMDEVLD
jgi:hypothetical protein